MAPFRVWQKKTCSADPINDNIIPFFLVDGCRGSVCLLFVASLLAPVVRIRPLVTTGPSGSKTQTPHPLLRYRRPIVEENIHSVFVVHRRVLLANVRQAILYPGVYCPLRPAKWSRGVPSSRLSSTSTSPLLTCKAFLVALCYMPSFRSRGPSAHFQVLSRKKNG